MKTVNLETFFYSLLGLSILFYIYINMYCHKKVNENYMNQSGYSSYNSVYNMAPQNENNQLEKEELEEAEAKQDQDITYALKQKTSHLSITYNDQFDGTYKTCKSPNYAAYNKLDAHNGSVDQNSQCAKAQTIQLNTNGNSVNVCSFDGTTMIDPNVCSQCCQCGVINLGNQPVSSGLCIPINPDGRLKTQLNRSLFENNLVDTNYYIAGDDDLYLITNDPD